MKTRVSVFRFVSVAIVLSQAIGARRAVANERFGPEARAHWAFQPVSRPVPPMVKQTRWVRNPIDAFVLAELENNAIAPSPPAEKATLLRRACLDLIGLPPVPSEVDAFLADRSPDAFEKVVDQLLASPRYGERWARHWLDLARYAESEGFKEDETRPNIWRYRDYVIKSFNDDKPYDRFIKEQLAGDELWPESFEARIATAFNRHYPDEHNARDLRQRRQEILNDITDTVGAVFTGMTYACARCHDHKFDPILQTDYYRLQGFFANVMASDNIPLLSANELKEHRAKLSSWEDKTRLVRDQMAALEAPKRKEMEEELIRRYPAEVQDAIAKRPEERTSFEWLMYHKAQQYLDPNSHQYVASIKAVVAALKPEQKKKWEALKVELNEFNDLPPGEVPMASAIADASCQAPQTFLLNRGLYDQPREELEPGFLQILHPKPAQIVAPSALNSTGRRTALANLLASPENPLTDRVMVNRIWHYHFGRGIVGTPSDFGMHGERPTHPALLDWLTAEFVGPSSGAGFQPASRGRLAREGSDQTDAVRGRDAPEGRLEARPTTASTLSPRRSEAEAGQRSNASTLQRFHASTPPPWSIKHIHRLIMLSNTYRQSSGFNPAAAKKDPDDKLLWRFPRHRLEGEVIRDQSLAVSGRLNTRMGGPSVFPELPPGMAARGGWKTSADEADRNRRSIYVFVKRNTRYPLFESFDMPDTHESCPRRNVTTSPVQALSLLNSELSMHWAQAMAGRVIESAGTNLSRQIETAFWLAYSRPPDKAERKIARDFFQRHASVVTERLRSGAELAFPP